ncbi:MAG: 50S ribosomal protein L18 [Nanoarchaeota archaeon]|nr:50S ribosomal protein L18 [Nanoarchaeota archaeon]
MLYQKYTVRKRRRREGRTNYKKRIKLLLSKKPRLVVRKTNDHITAQIIEFNPKGDKVLASAHSKNLQKLGWTFSNNNLPASYLLGMLIAQKSKEKKCIEAILDTGLNSSIKGSKIYAVAKGAIDNGLNIHHSINIIPDEKRLNGEHIIEYAKKVKGKGTQFSKFDPNSFKKIFEEVKNKIIK